MDHYDLVRDLTVEYARKVIGDEADQLEVKFSNSLKYPNAKCFPFRKMIVFNGKYVTLNKDNFEALRYTIIEECAHLKYFHHSDDFYNLCIELGCDVRTPPHGTRFYWKYHKTCNKCGDAKFYYYKPRKIVCQKCGSDSINLIESDL